MDAICKLTFCTHLPWEPICLSFNVLAWLITATQLKAPCILMNFWIQVTIVFAPLLSVAGITLLHLQTIVLNSLCLEIYIRMEEECTIPEIQTHRWYIVAVVGTLLSIISLISNILIARVLLQQKHSNFFFLGLLAVSDVFLSFCYFPVVAMDVVRYNVGVSNFVTGPRFTTFLRALSPRRIFKIE